MIKVLWQLPQILLGELVIVFSKARKDNGYWKTDCKFGVSLGPLIIMNNDKELKHEQGHTKQSLILGPLYLIIIGIPSALHNLWHRKHKETNYYDFWCEKWADKLGGVTR